MNKRFTTYIGSLVFALSTFFALAGFGSTAYAVVDDTPDCDDGVAIINCGTGKTTDEMRARYDKNATGDLPKIFGAFGISRADLNGTFQNGVVWRNGNVTVDGKVVATGAMTAGRNFGGTPIAGTNAGKYPTSKFATEGQTAWVKMINGKFDFAIIKSCGNPVTAVPKEQPPAPAFKCVNLTAEKITRTKYKFTATAQATGGATIEKYEFGFGDGFGITVAQNTYTYEYKKAGTFKTNVVVHVKVNGVIKKVTSPACEKTITVEEEKIRVCELATKKIITINASQFDATKHSKNLNDCKEAPTPTTIQVCELATKTVITINESEFDSTKHSKDLNVCKEVPQVLAATGPTDIALGGLGLSSLTAAGYYWRASRSRLIAKLLNQ